MRNWGIEMIRKWFKVTLLRSGGVLIYIQAAAFWAMVLTLVLTPCQTWGQAFYLDLTFTMIFKVAFSIYKGSEIKKLAKSIFIICSPKHSSLTLGWPYNLLFEVQSPFKSGKGHYHAGKVGPNQDSPKQTVMHEGPLPFWTWPPDWWFSTSNLWRVLKNDQKSVSPGFCKLVTFLLHSPYMLISFMGASISPLEALLD